MERKTLLIAAIGVIVVGLLSLRWLSERAMQEQPQPAFVEPTYAPVYSDSQFETKQAVDATLNTEIDQIDADLKSLNDADFDSTTLQESKVGL